MRLCARKAASVAGRVHRCNASSVVSERRAKWIRGQQVVVASMFVGGGAVVAVAAGVTGGVALLLLIPAAALVASGVTEIRRVSRANTAARIHP